MSNAKPIYAWVYARVLDFLICIIIVFGSSLINSQEIGRLKIVDIIALSATIYFFAYIVGGFLFTSGLWAYMCIKVNVGAIWSSIGSGIILIITLVGIHIASAGWAHTDYSVIIHPFLLVAILLHIFAVWLSILFSNLR
jgi:hypothetical protein